MRQSPAGRRARGRPNRRPHNPAQRNSNFDSNGPDGRVRGTAHQVYEKYCSLGRDSLSAGDRVQAETYFQHAEHYFRVLNSSTDPQPDELNGRSSRAPVASPESNAVGNGMDAEESQPQTLDTPPNDQAIEQPAEGAGAPDGSSEAAAAEGLSTDEAAPREDNRGRRRTLRSRKPTGNSRKAPAESADAEESQESGEEAAPPARGTRARSPRQPRRAAAASKSADPENPSVPEGDGE